MQDRIVIRGDGLHYFLEGKEVSEPAYRDRYPLPGPGPSVFRGTGVKPHPSDALAVHPEQVSEAVEDAKRKGVPTEFLPDGRPIMRSRAHQKQYVKAYGFFNKDGGYGD